MRIRAAASDDLASVMALLDAAGLPTGGVADFFPGGYTVAVSNAEVVGCAGLEVYDEVGLLRSVAVHPNRQRRGVGQALVADRIRAARAAHLRAVYLLTTTASGYFSELGFAGTDRQSVPQPLAASREFASVCPASARCLVLAIPSGPSQHEPGSRG